MEKWNILRRNSQFLIWGKSTEIIGKKFLANEKSTKSPIPKIKGGEEKKESE